MIIVKLIGGLGNQFFQYALGRHLAIKNHTALKLDVSGFADYKVRQYGLNHFNVIEECASAEEIGRFRARESDRFRRMSLRLGILPEKLRFTTIIEDGFAFCPATLEARGNIYIDGYWQSEKYFKEIEDVLRQEFTLRNAPDPAQTEIAEAINETNSVSVHVRRGDYVSSPEIYKIHGVCSPEYYSAAIDALSNKVDSPHYFVFSDDPQWARENLAFNHPVTLVSDKADSKDYEELWLMSRCKHHIIANSSFSWWGAWLGRNPEKQVFAPRAWFQTRERDTRDLIPNEWHVL